MKPKNEQAEARVRVGKFRFRANELGEALTEMLAERRAQLIGQLVISDIQRHGVKETA